MDRPGADRRDLALIAVISWRLPFAVSEPEAYRRDVPKAEVQILAAGHFALDTAADKIADLVRQFVSNGH